MMASRPLAVMGDGGFWHNGLLSGVASNLLNKGDAVLVVMQNGYSSATGTQELISSPPKDSRDNSGASATHADRTIENALQGLGVQWVRTVHTYDVSTMQRTLNEALTTGERGLKVIVAEGECQLERQRRVKPETARKLKSGERVVKVKYGVDEDTCTGDHSCIRLSGCPTLTVKDNPDPLRKDPVATVIDGCVGCGLCGENAHAATLCPSFYRAEVVQNPGWWDRFLNGFRNLLVPA
jgi:indolepyruvate ferredoxin oxidoreductase alpha subunit